MHQRDRLRQRQHRRWRRLVGFQLRQRGDQHEQPPMKKDRMNRIYKISNGTGTRASILLILLILSLCSRAASVTLEWDANTEPNIAGYRVYWGTASRTYSRTLSVTTTSATITNLFPGTNYFAVTAFDDNGLESDFSDEVWTVIRPGKPTGFRIRVVVALQSAAEADGPWETDALFASLDFADDPRRFYRAKMEVLPSLTRNDQTELTKFAEFMGALVPNPVHSIHPVNSVQTRRLP
jgi:hypothetical protein